MMADSHPCYSVWSNHNPSPASLYWRNWMMPWMRTIIVMMAMMMNVMMMNLSVDVNHRIEMAKKAYKEFRDCINIVRRNKLIKTWVQLNFTLFPKHQTQIRKSEPLGTLVSSSECPPGYMEMCNYFCPWNGTDLQHLQCRGRTYKFIIVLHWGSLPLLNVYPSTCTCVYVPKSNNLQPFSCLEKMS